MRFLRHLPSGHPGPSTGGEAAVGERGTRVEHDPSRVVAKRAVRPGGRQAGRSEPPGVPQKVVFAATGTIQLHPVPTTGAYLIEAAGGQGGAGGRPGTGGARLSGIFLLKGGDVVKIVAGRRGVSSSGPHLPGGKGGASLVWTGSSDLPAPIKLMLSARGGAGGAAVSTTGRPDSFAQMRPPGARPGGTAAGPELRTVGTVATQWTGAAGAVRPLAARAPGPANPGGYNTGAFRNSALEAQMGDGYVSITPVLESHQTAPGAGPDPDEDQALRDDESTASAVNRAVSFGAPSETEDDEPPTPTLLPPVTPRQPAWSTFLRRGARPRPA